MKKEIISTSTFNTDINYNIYNFSKFDISKGLLSFSFILLLILFYNCFNSAMSLGKLQTDGDDAFVFRILSFNILAQNLLEAHPYLYMQHNREALSWDIRKPLLLQEILQAQADVRQAQNINNFDIYIFIYRYFYYNIA